MSDSEKIRAAIKALFKVQKLTVLSTHQDGQPYASLVAFAASKDLKELFFATARTTRKFFNLSGNPRVAMLIDSRSNQDSDFHEAVAVTAVGKAEEVQGEEKEACQEIYLTKHPHLEGFVNSPTCALVRVKVTSYYMVSRFQKVTELHLNHEMDRSS